MLHARLSGGESPVSTGAPAVSVVIPCHGQAHFLARALESVVRQRGIALEAIVVDDGSPDDVRAVCSRYGAVRYVRQEHAGLAAARNLGIKKARGRLLHFLDADDAVEDGLYAEMAAALRARPEWTAVVCGTRFMRDDGSPSDQCLDPPLPGALFPVLARSNPFPPGALVLRRSVLSGTGLFDTRLEGTADWDLWLRVARTGATFGAVTGPRFLYRLHRAGMSRRAVRMFEEYKVVLERARGHDPRVQTPSPEFAAGLGPGDTAESIADAAAACLGKAIGGGDVEAAARLAGELLSSVRGRPGRRHLEMLFSEAALTCGCLPPRHLQTFALCSPLLLRLGLRVRRERAVLALVRDVALHLCGAHRARERVRAATRRRALSSPRA